MPPPPLVDDVVEDVLIRFPPKDPAALVRAALVCKSWLRLVYSPSFRRRFSEFHCKPPMLGMFCNEHTFRFSKLISVSHFVPTTAFRLHDAERGRIAVDARHGRVLLREGTAFIVWDPITDDKWKVPSPPQCTGVEFSAAALCSAAGAGGGCDHLDCHRGPFIVVLVASVRTAPAPAEHETFIYTYSSNAAAWSEPTCGQRPGYIVNPFIRSVLVGSTLYFADFPTSSTALKYNMQLRQMSWIQLPSSFPLNRLSALTTTGNGGLQFAIEHEYKLYIWSTKDADEIDTRWEQNRVIELNKLLPVDANLNLLEVAGYMDDLSTIFVSDDDAVYAIDLMTCKVKKVYEGRIHTIIPYMSFYTPALQADDTGDGGSSA